MAPGSSAPRSDAVKLFWLGCLGLFLELLLIRWLAGTIWNLGYFPNLVLIAAFVGLGIGFVFHERVPDSRSPILFHAALGVLLALAAFLSLARPAVPGFEQWRGVVGGELFFTAVPARSGAADPLYFALWFLSVVAIFALIAQRTAKVFRGFAPLRAYSLDIAGSCAGIVAFMAVSWLELPAWSWFLLLLPIFLGAMPRGGPFSRLLPAVALAAVALLAWRQDQALLGNPDLASDFEVVWSPYQKIEFAHESAERQSLFVNGVGHQHLLPLATIETTFYNVPYHYRRDVLGRPPYESVLVIGAGTGNDVAAALHFGAKHVDAVEIDPAIARLGRAHHLARPYDDPRVRLVVDDARAFMTRTDRRYDLVIFALTDSLVKVSALAQLRLENYVFTEESIRRAFDLLTEDGALLFYNSYRQEWLLRKIQETIHRATDRWPRTLWSRGDFFVLFAGRDTAATAGPPPGAAPADTPTDDWPFLYLERRGIPGLYVGAMLGLAGFVALLLVGLQHSTRQLETGEAGPGRLLLKIAFVGMGAAFLLLETKGVIQFSLLFGTTWTNNSLVFLAALLLVLAANAVAARITDPRALPLAFVLLVVSCLATLVYPLGNLLGVASPALRFALASLLTFSPIFFANLIFSLTFRDQPVAEHLFGWNLIGTTLGGVVEYTSMWAGYNALAVVVALCYAGVFALIFLARRASSSLAVR